MVWRQWLALVFYFSWYNANANARAGTFNASHCFNNLIYRLNCTTETTFDKLFQRRSFWSTFNRFYIPNNNTKLITKPIRPEASTKEKPINEKRNNSSR